MLREILSNDGYVYCSLVSLFILMIVKSINNRRLVDFLGFLGNSNYLRIYIKEHRFLDPFDSLLFVNFCINLGAFFWIIFQSYFNAGEIYFSPFLILTGTILLWFLIKIGVEILIGYAFDTYNLFNILSFQQISSLNFIGILLIPLNAIIVFGANLNTNLILITSILIPLIVALGMIKTLRSNLNIVRPNIFYFILYICTLEIAPYVVIYDYIDLSKFF